MQLCTQRHNSDSEHDMDGLVQKRRNSIANALELRHSCTNTSICICLHKTYSNVFEFMEYKICKSVMFDIYIYEYI